MPAGFKATFLEAVQEVAKAVGHPMPATVASSTDEAVLRMGFYVNQTCVGLLQMHDWTDLILPGTIAIVASTPGISEEGFALPTDFHSFVDDTQWDDSTQLPAVGPVNPQDWQWLKVRQASITTRLMWRLRQGELYIKSPPSTSVDFVFEYVSKNWAVDDDNVTAKAWMENDGDYHLYPWNLVVLGARAMWLKNEGYDSTAAEKTFSDAFASETGSNVGATALSLVPGSGYPYLNPNRNLPDTGYGS